MVLVVWGGLALVFWAGGIYILLNRAATASEMQRYYASRRPERFSLRPNDTQAALLTMVFVAFALVSGSIFLAVGLASLR